MKFPSLIIENFLAIKQAKLNLADRGLLLIQGVNEDDSSADSNGAGKSSVGDAISWCLYGVTARGESGDAIINRAERKGTLVSLEIVDGDDIYKATRHRKHKTGKNALHLHKQDSLSASWKDITQGTDKLTQELLDKIIGSSYEVFCAAIYAGQEKMPDLPGMTDKQLKVLVEEAAGVTVLEAAYEKARENLAVHKEDVADARLLFSKREAHVENLKTYLKEIIDKAAAWESERLTRYNNAYAELAVVAKEYKQLEDRKTASRSEDIKDLLEALDDINAKIAGVGEERKKEIELIGIAGEADREVTAAVIRADSAKKVLDQRTKAASEVEHQVGCPCSECGKLYTQADIEPAKDQASARVVEAANEVDNARKILKAAEKRAGEAHEALVKHRASMTDISAETTARDALKESIQSHHDLVKEAADKLKEVKRLKADREAINAEISPFSKLYTEQEAKIAVEEKARDEHLVKIKEADSRQELLEAAVKVFGPAGVRAHILDEITPFLNDQTAKYLATLSDGNLTATWTTMVPDSKGALKEKFSIEITSISAGENFKLISGGEKKKVRIATALALQDLVARRASKPIELFIGDEIDGALDPAGQERLSMVLEEKAKERGTVLIITHTDMRDWISQTITVRKKGGLSTIEESVS